MSVGNSSEGKINVGQELVQLLVICNGEEVMSWGDETLSVLARCVARAPVSLSPGTPRTDKN